MTTEVVSSWKGVIPDPMIRSLCWQGVTVLVTVEERPFRAVFRANQVGAFRPGAFQHGNYCT